jgi:methylaspartate mutase epsilon subunit
MGLYPTTDAGAYRLLGQAAELAVNTGSERLIVKTVAESRRIPTIEENVAALEHAAAVARRTAPGKPADPGRDSQTYQEAATLVAAVLDADADIGQGLLAAFHRGHLDIPYCVHPDNAGRTRSYIDVDGWLRWVDIGALPLAHLVKAAGARRVTSRSLLADLSYVRRTFDGELGEVRAGSGVR